MGMPRQIALAATLLLGILLAQTSGAATSLTLGTASGTPGQAVTIPVTFTNDGTVVSLQFDVQYNASQLTAGTPTAGAALGTNGLASSRPLAGTQRVVITPTAGNALVASGQVATLAIIIASGATAGNQTLSLSNVILSNAAATSVAAGTLGSGQVTIGSGGDGADVCATGCTYTSIQSAVNAAANGATITIGAGTYHESVTITNNKTVTGSGNPADVVIDATGLSTHAVQINGGALIGVTVTGGQSSNGGGVYASGAATVHNNIIQGNTATGNGGGIWVPQYAQVDIQNNTIRNNTAGNGGGLYVISYANATINANTLSGNSATNGGGLYTESYCDCTLTNLLIINNTAQNGGGGIYINSYSYPVLINITLSGNSSSGGGGIFASGYGHGTAINTIAWGNSTADIQSAWGGLSMSYSVTPSYGGTNMISADPHFANVANGDYHLTAGSPAIDTGLDTSGSGVVSDLDGHSRPRGSAYDIGCYEY